MTNFTLQGILYNDFISWNIWRQINQPEKIFHDCIIRSRLVHVRLGGGCGWRNTLFSPILGWSFVISLSWVDLDFLKFKLIVDLDSYIFWIDPGPYLRVLHLWFIQFFEFFFIDQGLVVFWTQLFRLIWVFFVLDCSIDSFRVDCHLIWSRLSWFLSLWLWFWFLFLWDLIEVFISLWLYL